MRRTTLGLLLVALSPAVLAEDQIVVDGEMLKTIWVAVCCALVLLMQPGFAMLEAGAARAKNAVNVLMKNFTDVGLGALGYWAFGFAIMFGTNPSGWFGTSGFFFSPAGGEDAMDLVFQMLFAATAATIISGAVAERIRFMPYVAGAFVITALVYPLYGAWAWGGTEENPGWLRGLGFIDAAGSSVVHAIGGWAALGAATALGPRLGRFSRKGEPRPIPGHNLPIFAFGGFLLWVGWFGFNGSAVGDDFGDLGTILLNTQLGAVAGITSALAYMTLTRQPILMTNTINGALGGLVAVTAGCATMTAGAAALTGLVAGLLVVAGTNLLVRLRIDDVVGAVPVHALCGAWGTIAAGIFFVGDLFNPDRVITQLIGTIVAFAWAFPLSYGVFKLVDLAVGIRASTMHEQRGLDFTEHYELGYNDFMAARTQAHTA